MHSSVSVDMCITISSGCPVTYMITSRNQVDISIGGQRDGFYYAFDAAALRTFLEVGAEALARLEEQIDANTADQKSANAADDDAASAQYRPA